MVEPALFDIYLCDNCDAELYSLDACMEHEKICSANMKSQHEDDDDDDVIFIEDDESQIVPGRGKQPEFLSNFGLCSTSAPMNMSQTSQGRRAHGHIHLGDYFGSPEKLRRLPNRSRGVIALSKCATIPISSPCGQLLLKQSKTMMSEDYQLERIDRIERFCHAPILFSNSDRPRYITATANPGTSKQSRYGNSTNVTYRKPLDQEETYYHTYKFPRRQLSTKQRSEHFNFLNSLLLKACKPVSVKVKRLSNTDIEICKARLRQAAQKLSFDVPKDNHNVVEYIDLCSSDEEGEEILGNDRGEPMDSSGSAGTEVDENQMAPQQKVDGIVMSMPINSNCSSLLVQQIPEPPKALPLRPSIFLFSNYQRYSSNNNQFMSGQQQTPTTPTQCSVSANTGPYHSQSQEEFLAAKTNSINEWLNSTQNSMQMDHLNTNTNNLRQIPGLVNIQQYTTTAIHQSITTAIHQTITTANIAT